MRPSTGRGTATRDYGGVSARQRGAERRQRLLDAGRRLWGRGGINDVTVRGVCAEARLGPRYFYEQFADRDALLLAVADEVRDEMIAVLLQRGLNEPGDIEDKLRAALRALLGMIAADPFVYRIFADILTGTGEFAERRRQALEIVTDLVLEHGPPLLKFDTASPAELRRGATFIVGGANQLIDAWVNDPHETTDELADACTELCLSVVRMVASRR